MNGATAVPCVKKISIPNNNKTITIGKIQNFFLFKRNVKNSLRNDSIINTGY